MQIIPQATAPKAILVVDDDTELRAHICDYLSERGFIVDEASDGREMDEALKRRTIDLIVLDVMLPGEDGLLICRRLSRQPGPAIVMLSAMGEEVDRVLGLEMGADGYLPKPCSPRELLAHIRAVLRRREEPSGAAIRAAEVSRFAGFTLDLRRRQLTAPNGATVLLTAAEFALLGVLLESPRKIVSREQMAGAARGGDSSFMERSVDVLVSRLRRKLHTNGRDELIRTYRREGYLLDAEVTH